MKKHQSVENTPDAENQSEGFVICCGGIKPIVPLPEEETEEDKCTEQS